jgi:DNA helicase-2/ATP-dependent DNA helicase PcrA
MDLNTFHEILAQPSARGYSLDPEQRKAVDFGMGPLWLIAGPGSGKTEVLVTRTLKLLCVDQVDPRSVLITTFTRKAARNLEDRLATYLGALQVADSTPTNVDLADLRAGTIHSLCNDILQEFRYPAYQNVRLLDEVDQSLFTYRYAAITDYQELSFWTQFEYCVPMWRASSSYAPNKWARTAAAITLFNHIVEDLVDVDKMTEAGGEWAKLADFYKQYCQALVNQYRCDFAHLQKRFLDFLTTQSGHRFLNGDGGPHLPLQYVLVDEYQDTNPIQERIYLALADRSPHNLTVVGDDDQALYRFRGGTVSCMVNFDRACKSVIGSEPQPVQLLGNYRSHPEIVNFFNDYIQSFPEMKVPGVRAPDKKKVKAESDIADKNPPYDAVAWITRRSAGDIPNAVAGFVRDALIGDKVIQDLSQCVLLMRSTKDSPRNAGPFLDAFKRHDIPVYNPRSKSFMESEEVQCLLAALIHVVDPLFVFMESNVRGLSATVQGWIDRLIAVHEDPAVDTASMYKYIVRSNEELPKLCAQNAGTFLDVSLLEIIYRLLSRNPFAVWRKDDPVRNSRLAKVTRLFESYHSLNLDKLVANDEGTGLAQSFVNRFYNMFISFLLSTGIDDEEDEEVIVPPGYFPFMTIHQAKGLEFPLVFVDQLGHRGSVGPAQILERDLAPFRHCLYERSLRSPEQLAVEDDIRLLYVAYSRAQYGLVLAGTKSQLVQNVAIPGRDYDEFHRNTAVID